MSDIVYFGNPTLRKTTKALSVKEIKSIQTQKVLTELMQLVKSEKFGVGLAAPQIGKSIPIAIIAIKPTPTRPDLKKIDKIIINPSYKGVGKKFPVWEGCISSGKGENTLYAKVPRYKKIDCSWQDEKAKKHKKIIGGFEAHVFQHEADHLKGILFVDKVVDTKSYMLADEYRKRISKNERKAKVKAKRTT